jgi:hypothetical protein
MPGAVKGALPALSAGNAPFTASPMPVTRLSQQVAGCEPLQELRCSERAFQDGAFAPADAHEGASTVWRHIRPDAAPNR